MWPQGIYNKAYMDERFDPFNQYADFEYKFSFMPRRCYKTGKLLWMTTALRGRIISRSGDVTLTVVDRWYDRGEGIIMMLKKVSE